MGLARPRFRPSTLALGCLRRLVVTRVGRGKPGIGVLRNLALTIDALARIGLDSAQGYRRLESARFREPGPSPRARQQTIMTIPPNGNLTASGLASRSGHCWPHRIGRVHALMECGKGLPLERCRRQSTQS